MKRHHQISFDHVEINFIRKSNIIGKFVDCDSTLRSSRRVIVHRHEWQWGFGLSDGKDDECDVVIHSGWRDVSKTKASDDGKEASEMLGMYTVSRNHPHSKRIRSFASHRYHCIWHICLCSPSILSASSRYHSREPTLCVYELATISFNMLLNISHASECHLRTNRRSPNSIQHTSTMRALVWCLCSCVCVCVRLTFAVVIIRGVPLVERMLYCCTSHTYFICLIHVVHSHGSKATVHECSIRRTEHSLSATLAHTHTIRALVANAAIK